MSAPADAGTLAEALQSLGDRPSLLQVKAALRRLDAAPAEGFTSVTLGVAASFTFDLLLPALRVRAYTAGLRLRVVSTPFGQYRQMLLDPDSPLVRERPDFVLLAIRLEDACPRLVSDFNALSATEAAALADGWRAELVELLRLFRSRSAAHVLCANYEQPAFPSLGYADAVATPGQAGLVRALNDWLAGLSAQVGDVQVLDVDGLAARVGRERFVDPRLELLARCPVAAEHHWDYAGEVVRALRMRTGRARKVLVLDCDNTLWGGVLGDVGRDGIRLGREFPGNAYRALQQRALELQRRGVVLVIASKNERAAVLDVFENHPEMVLRPEHISYFAVNWEPKPQNLRQAAERLGLGLDSFVFLDDHPVECAQLRAFLPEVWTVQLPADPALFERTLARLDLFDQPVVSTEDRRRGALYREEAARAELRAEAGDLQAFYRGLQMQMQISRNDESGLARAAQLTQRTNQFNMTTIRRSEAELLTLLRSGTADLFTLRLVDRFGDNGLVGLAIVVRDGPVHRLDTFLMSCRVLGRTVEGTFLTWLARTALASGAERFEAEYRPTAKNRPFAGFFEEWGMQRLARDPAGNERWGISLSPAAAALTLPDWFVYDPPIEARGS